MSNPQYPLPPSDPGIPSPGPSPLPPGFQAPGQQFYPAAPPPPLQPAPKKGGFLTSKPVIGAASLVVGLVVGSGIGAAGRPATGVTAAAAPTVTVTTVQEAPAADEPAAEPTEEATQEPAQEPTEEPVTPADTSFRWGQTAGFLYEDVEITLKVEAPKPSTNMFDDDNLEERLTVCNKGGDTIEELSAEGMGLYAEDKGGGQYDLYGPYRAPEFPGYSWDSTRLKAGKCRSGWVSFEDGRRAIRIALDIDDETYTWSKSG
jgi:hypothetical protein